MQADVLLMRTRIARIPRRLMIFLSRIRELKNWSPTFQKAGSSYSTDLISTFIFLRRKGVKGVSSNGQEICIYLLSLHDRRSPPHTPHLRRMYIRGSPVGQSKRRHPSTVMLDEAISIINFFVTAQSSIIYHVSTFKSRCWYFNVGTYPVYVCIYRIVSEHKLCFRTYTGYVPTTNHFLKWTHRWKNTRWLILIIIVKTQVYLFLALWKRGRHKKSGASRPRRFY